MMPDLPNVGWERDMESFREFFENPAFRSDGLKVFELPSGTGFSPSCLHIAWLEQPRYMVLMHNAWNAGWKIFSESSIAWSS